MSIVGQYESEIERAAEAIAAADAVLIGAGAGMGVDSGLPDFRGDEGFWTAYPPFRGKSFSVVSNPNWFRSDPDQAWGFFGHRLNLYRATEPHSGFEIVRRWAQKRPLGYFVFTSNVDGHFQKAGFPEDQLLECHGSIHYLQCSSACSTDAWSACDVSVVVDESTIRATSDLPKCIHCRSIARPNILMFGDFEWNSRRFDTQRRRYRDWVNSVEGKRTVIIELGAGRSIPTVRQICENQHGTLIRVNPCDEQGPPNTISLPMSALDAIRRIDAML